MVPMVCSRYNIRLRETPQPGEEKKITRLEIVIYIYPEEEKP